MDIRAVLFDMDGVIVNTEPLHRKAYEAMFEEFGLKVPDKLYESFMGRSTLNICRELVEDFNLDETAETLISRKRAYYKEFFEHDPDFQLIPGVRALIENYYRNGIKMVLASSASRAGIEQIFDRFGLNPFFKGKISGAELPKSKPNPEIFIRAAEIAEEPKSKCLVIEDSTNGFRAAHDAGIFCVAYKNPFAKNQDYTLADKTITQYGEIFSDKLVGL